jgi:hypothetical protein
MSESTTNKQLQYLAKLFNWKLWSTGIMSCGIYYLEVETTNQYDEIPFDSARELAEYVDEIFVTC